MASHPHHPTTDLHHYNLLTLHPLPTTSPSLTQSHSNNPFTITTLPSLTTHRRPSPSTPPSDVSPAIAINPEVPIKPTAICPLANVYVNSSQPVESVVDVLQVLVTWKQIILLDVVKVSEFIVQVGALV